MQSICEIPYTDRRVVIIFPKTDDLEKDSSLNKKGLMLSILSGTNDDTKKYIFENPLLKTIALGAMIATSAIPVFPLSIIGITKLYKLYNKFILKNIDNKNIKKLTGCLPLPYEEAIKEFSFPSGHPIKDTAYVCHPINHKKYLPFALFHNWIFEEKVNELITLLASLGAIRVLVTANQGYSIGSGISIGAEIEKQSGEANISGKKDKKKLATFEEHFRPTGKASIPDNLLWYSSEISWQSLADRRLKFNTSNFNVVLNYTDSFGIDGELKAGLEGFGIKLGGNFNKFSSTSWTFEGEFI